MGLFGKSLEEKVNAAIDDLRGKHPEVRGLSASVADKVVTLNGQTASMAAKTAVMNAFNQMVETENTINMIRVDQPAPAPAGAGPVPSAAGPVIPGPADAESEPRMHTVVSGDTLSGLAKKYYGKASAYMKIFEANRDQLNDPDKIKVGQKLRIPD